MKSLQTIILASGYALVLFGHNVSFAQAGIGACADIKDAGDRLACYDEAAESARDLPVVRLPRSSRPAPVPQADDESQRGNSAAVRQDDFGLELKQERKKETGPDSRSYRVLAASHNDFTGWTIEFEDGGKWKQVGTEDYDINVGETYTVRRATFNSYMLSNSNNNRKIRITRIE